MSMQLPSTNVNSEEKIDFEANEFYQQLATSTPSLSDFYIKGLEKMKIIGNNRTQEEKGKSFFIAYLKSLVADEFENNRHFDDSDLKVLILNTLAASCLVIGVYDGAEENRNEQFSQAMHYINRADRIDIQQGISFALKGFLLFFQGQYDKCPRYFDQSLILKSNYIFAYIGKAVCSFVSKNYEEALRNLRSALDQDCDLPEEIYVGKFGFNSALAYSYYCSEEFSNAKLVVECILEINPNQIDAKLLSASLSLQTGDIETYLEHFTVNPQNQNCLFLLNLAEIHLIRGTFDLSLKEVESGLEVLESWPRISKGKDKNEWKTQRLDFFELKSRFIFIKAFVCHSEGNLSEAIRFYKEAALLSPSNLSAQYGYGQLLIQEKNYIDALKCFEHILENESSERVEELYKTLGYLYSKNMKRTEAIEFYKKAIRFDPNDFESLIEFAGIQEHHDPVSSLSSYEKALSLVLSNEEPEPELYNNIGVLKTKLGKENEAVGDFLEALAICKRRVDLDRKYSQLTCTIMFNLGAVYEELCLLGDAVTTYKSLISENAYYSDAYLRLAFLAYKRGSLPKALEYTEQALVKVEQSRSGRIDLPLCCKGFLLAENGEIDAAKAAFDSIKRRFNHDDSYAKLAILSLEYNTSVNLRHQSSEQSTMNIILEKYLRKLIEDSKFILLSDEHNIQAALTIGVALAESGYLREAREIFNSLLEASQSNSNILGNMGILEFLQRNYDNAIRILSSFVQKTKTPKDMANILALSYFFKRDFGSALKILKIAILRNPHLLSLRFNFSELLYRIAHETLDNSLRSKEGTHSAIIILNKILPVFDFFHTNHLARMAEAALEKSDEARQERKKVLEQIRDKSENRANFIRDYQERFEEILMADEETEKKRRIDKTETQKVLLQITKKENKKKEFAKSKEEKLKIERELKAAQEMELAKKMLEDIQFDRVNKPKRKSEGKGSKGKKPKKEEDIHREVFGNLDRDEDEEDDDDFLMEELGGEESSVGSLDENEFGELDDDNAKPNDEPIIPKKRKHGEIENIRIPKKIIKKDSIEQEYNPTLPQKEIEPNEDEFDENPKKKRKLVKNKVTKRVDDEDNPFAGIF